MVGTDIIEVSRIEKLIKDKGDKFLNRIYTKAEIDYCESKGPNKYQHYAGRFAAKEAVFKILSTKQLKFKNIEILNNDDGSPYIKSSAPYDAFQFDISISISHIKKYATAVAVMK
tara:strand:- start:470 stop:814 length:345 start_codon:yes stop_codon:yes gene_type:complete